MALTPKLPPVQHSYIKQQVVSVKRNSYVLIKLMFFLSLELFGSFKFH